jgi:hypothetical protein
MKILSPCIITARLLPGVKIGDSFVSITYSKRAGEGSRTRYQWFIDTPKGEFEGHDLQSGQHGGSLQDGLESLLSFLGAAAASYAYEMRGHKCGDNSDLFDERVNEWAYQNSDEISMLEIEIHEKQGKAIIE